MPLTHIVNEELIMPLTHIVDEVVARASGRLVQSSSQTTQDFNSAGSLTLSSAITDWSYLKICTA